MFDYGIATDGNNEDVSLQDGKDSLHSNNFEPGELMWAPRSFRCGLADIGDVGAPHI